MRVSNDGVPPADSQADDQEKDTSSNDNKGQPSAFSRALAKKQAVAEDGNYGGSKRRSEELDLSLLGVQPDTAEFARSMQVPAVESKHIVQMPVELQQLVREISVVAGGHQVNIELNSSVLKGLHIRIEKQNGAVAIQFQSNSENVSKLISQNIDSLAQGLSDRGVNVADIRVASAQNDPKKHNYKSASDQGRREQSGRQTRR
jgi:hypothetical protein